MPKYKAQCSFQYDTLLPRDAMVINPCFNVVTFTGFTTPDPGGMAKDLGDALASWTATPGPQITVKLYDLQGSKPNYPAATYVKNAGASPVSVPPRELAVCLSFYAGQNVGRRRGRLYLPAACLSAAGVSLRPTSSHTTKAAALVPILTGLGGINVDWCVWSQRDLATRPITDWWVNDDWDSQRKRGLRETTRTKGTTSENDIPNILDMTGLGRDLGQAPNPWAEAGGQNEAGSAA